MRNLLLAGIVAISGLAFVTPASAQGFSVDTPVGGVHVGRDRGYDRDYERRSYRSYDRPGYRAYGYDRDYRRGDCRTITIRRDDGSVKRIHKCG
jgi:hypothetical protein